MIAIFFGNPAFCHLAWQLSCTCGDWLAGWIWKLPNDDDVNDNDDGEQHLLKLSLKLIWQVIRQYTEQLFQIGMRAANDADEDEDDDEDCDR